MIFYDLLEDYDKMGNIDFDTLNEKVAIMVDGVEICDICGGNLIFNKMDDLINELDIDSLKDDGIELELIELDCPTYKISKNEDLKKILKMIAEFEKTENNLVKIFKFYKSIKYDFRNLNSTSIDVFTNMIIPYENNVVFSIVKDKYVPVLISITRFENMEYVDKCVYKIDFDEMYFGKNKLIYSIYYDESGDKILFKYSLISNFPIEQLTSNILPILEKLKGE